MNAFSTPINTRPDLVKVIHGRKGDAKEFVEYRPCNKKINIVAQKSGAWFFVYRVERGKKGSVQTLASFHNADAASHQAHDIALAESQQE